MFLYYPQMQQQLDPYAEPDETVLDKVALRHPPSFREIEGAKKLFDVLGVQLDWLQWIIGKKLSEFEQYDWRIFVGLGIGLGDGDFSASEVRQYVIDMLNWAKLYDNLDIAWFETEEWPIDCVHLIDIPEVRPTSPEFSNQE